MSGKGLLRAIAVPIVQESPHPRAPKSLPVRFLSHPASTNPSFMALEPCRNTFSTAGNSMTSSERPSPDPLLQGQRSAQGILRLRNPNSGPNSVKRILDARILDPFPAKEAPWKIHPREIHLPKFTFQNSTQKSDQKIHIAHLQGRLADTSEKRGVLRSASPKVSHKRVGKDLTLYRIGKHSNPQNRPKIRQKNTKKIGFSVCLVYFFPILLVGPFSYSIEGQVFRNKRVFTLVRWQPAYESLGKYEQTVWTRQGG